MGIVFGGDGDINVEGVVGSERSNDDWLDPDLDQTRDDRVHTGIKHYGRGDVHINGERIR